MCLAEFAATYVAILFNLGYPTKVELLRNEVEEFMMPLNCSIASGDWGCTCDAISECIPDQSLLLLLASWLHCEALDNVSYYIISRKILP